MPVTTHPKGPNQKPIIFGGVGMVAEQGWDPENNEEFYSNYPILTNNSFILHLPPTNELPHLTQKAEYMLSDTRLLGFEDIMNCNLPWTSKVLSEWPWRLIK